MDLARKLVERVGDERETVHRVLEELSEYVLCGPTRLHGRGRRDFVRRMGKRSKIDLPDGKQKIDFGRGVDELGAQERQIDRRRGKGSCYPAGGGEDDVVRRGAYEPGAAEICTSAPDATVAAPVAAMRSDWPVGFSSTL